MSRHTHRQARADTLTPDLFEVPVPVEAYDASMDFRLEVDALVESMLHRAASLGMTRFQVAAEVSRLVGKEVSKYMLDAYCAESRDTFNAPAWLLPALEVVCQCHDFTVWLCQKRGGRFYAGREALAAELGRLTREGDALRAKQREIRRRLGCA